MASLDPLFEFRLHRTVASLEAPLARKSADLLRLADACDLGSAYVHQKLLIRGRYRPVAIPRAQLDSVHRHINGLLYPIDQSFSSSVHGYVTRRNALTNAQQHLGANHLSKFDIKEFFASIRVSDVHAKLSELGFGDDAARLIARLCTDRGFLPLGARTSPRISNIVLMGLDKRLETLADGVGAVYTRYADDLAFTADYPLDISVEVEEEVNTAGFQLNSTKTRIFKHGQPMFVTGLSISNLERPRVRARLKARLRQEFHYIEKFGLDEHASRLEEQGYALAHRLSGQFHYARAIEPSFTDKLRSKYPTATASIVPIHQDARIERANRHREELIRRVRAEAAHQLPMYSPTVAVTD